MTAVLQRSFRVLEELAIAPEGRTLSELVNELGLPLSATSVSRNDHSRPAHLKSILPPSLSVMFRYQRYAAARWP